MKIIKILFLLSLCFILIACDESTPNVDVENHTHITDNAVQEKFIGATCSLEGSYDEAKLIAKQIYMLATLSQRKLSAEELNEFLSISFKSIEDRL